jgi:two-component system sensor histidine kinase DesK
VLAERLRIARDLHDIVSHGLGMITVRAGTARHLHSQRPREDEHPGEEALLEALADVENASREATQELRHMLEALRESDEVAPRHPTDSLESLPAIIAGARRAGLHVELHHADLGALSPSVQLAICAIVREGLGNIARHAGSTRARIELSDVSDAVTVAVTDDGPSAGWAGEPGSGHGLVGLHERVTNLGGTLEAGPHISGYRLSAKLPKDDT